MGRKSIPILLKATSPEGETKMFISIGKAAKELGFSECGVDKAFHEKRNRISEYDPNSMFTLKLLQERLKKMFTRTVCIYCGGPLTCEDRVKNMVSVYLN